MELHRTLKTNRLVIRRFLPQDAPDLFEIRADPSVSAYDTWDPYVSEDQAREFITAQQDVTPHSESQWCLWAVLRRDAKVIGYVETIVRSQSWGQAEIGWALNGAYRGRGYATEAARRMISFSFDDLSLHRIYAECDPRNERSIRLMERVGMRREARLREVLHVKGEWQDRCVYAILVHEWNEHRRNEWA
jgi:RimJ/RimL family protein N-acetyltransferase